MHIEQLDYFLHVVESGSINATANKYFMTQQAINASLKKLEREIGSPLLIRSHKGIELTPQGHIFYHYAQTILSEYEELLNSLEKYEAENSDVVGNISIFTSSIFTEMLLPRVCSDFMRIYPKTMVKVLEIPNTEILEYFFARYSKLCFLTTSMENLTALLSENKNEKIKYLPLMEDEIVIVARPDNPLVKYKKVNFEELEEIYVKENMHFSLYQTYPFNNSEVALKHALSISNNPEIHKQFLSNNITTTYMPKMAFDLQFKPEGFISIPSEGLQRVVHGMLYWDEETDEDNELIKKFVEFLKKYFEHHYGKKKL